MCIIKECKNVKTYNFDGLEPEYCRVHKTDNMINVRHERCSECRFQASFGFLESNIRERCSIHRMDGMINLKHKNIICVSPHCTEARTPNLNGYCSVKCYINDNIHEYVYKDDSGILYKEYLLFKHLKQTYSHNIIWNKIFCCGYRPDFRISFDTFTLIIELDEYQHKSYDKKEEIDRIENMYYTSNIPLVIIRFNSDTYVGNKISVRSPFTKNILTNEVEWTNRLQRLNDTIQKYITDGLNNIVPSTYQIDYLFYDS
jgi:hypothetical protein